MSYPNYLQMTMLANHKPRASLHKYIEPSAFIFAFLSHIQEYFAQFDRQFRVLEPLLDSIFAEDTSTTLSLDLVELGELHLISSSLLYYSPSGLLESLVFNYEEYHSFHAGDYVLLLFEFCAILHGEAHLYEKNKKNEK